ncbi:MAG: Panacea domain-containing protein, partial [Cetobacterium sp.]
IYLKRILNIYYMEISKDKNITGNMILNLQKIENMILYFLKNCKNVYKTKLNKLMWYADFKNYQKNDESITGLAYIHKPFGAVPIGIDEMLKCFESIEIEEKEDEEKGYTYFDIKPLRDSDLTIFTLDELETLKSISNKFKDFGNKEISDYMHLETAYIETLDNERIEYEFARELKTI